MAAAAAAAVTTSRGASEHVRDQVEKGRKKGVFKVGGEQQRPARGFCCFFPILDFGLEQTTTDTSVGAARLLLGPVRLYSGLG